MSGYAIRLTTTYGRSLQGDYCQMPFRFSGCDTSPSGPAPLLGQHNREIAASLGYSDPEIETLQQGGVLSQGESI